MEERKFVEITTVPYGLRQEETIVQIANSLAQLEIVAGSVFQQVKDSVGRHQAILFNLNRRCEQVAAKVDALSRAKGAAVTIHCLSKFPQVDAGFDKLFQMDLSALENPTNTDVKLREKFPRYKESSVASKPQLFHTRGKITEEDPNVKERRIPQDLRYLGSLFTFSSGESVYNGVSFEKSPKVIFPVSSKNVEADVVDADKVANDSDDYNCFFTPVNKTVPPIDVPTDLPELPFSFASNNTETIPLSITPNLGEVECPDSLMNERESFIPATLSPLPCDDPNTVETAIEIGPIIQPAPPPPPPMPDIREDAVTLPKLPPFIRDPHAELMESIRKMGGAVNLRPSKKDTRDVSKDGNNLDVKDGGESNVFMEELFAKLALRRKGISGQNRDIKKVTVFERLADMIPADYTDSDTANDTDNEWDE